MSEKIGLKKDRAIDFLVGVNYWPRKKAMYWWKDFDEKEVREEFGEIRRLNLDVVRIFLDWEAFQPKSDEISSDALKMLNKVLNIAEKYNLKVIATFFCGYMSGISILPEWALDTKGKFYRHQTLSNGKLTNYPVRNLFEDKLMLEAQKLQIRTVAAEFSRHAAIHAWDLSNEVENLCMPRSHEVAKEWLRSLANEIRKVDSCHPVTCGFSTENVENEVITNWISDAAGVLDFLCMHGYPNYSKVVSNPLDADYVPFCNLLTQSLGKNPVLFEEFGIPTTLPGEGSRYIEVEESTSGTSKPYLASEEEAAEYYRSTLENLHRAGSLGALAWCFSDYDKRLWVKPPFDKCVHERFFGITRADGSVKPGGTTLSEFAGRKVLLPPTLFEVSSEYYEDPLSNFKALWASFKKRVMK